MKFRIFLTLILAAFLATPTISQKFATKRAPDFSLPDISGKNFKLSENYGRGPIYISFWATWCKPCIEELAEYKKIYKDYKVKGFKMFAISTDDERTVAKVKPFVKSKGFDFPVLLDTNSDISRLYYAQSVPYSVILDKKGMIIYSHLGYMKGDEVKVKEIISSEINK